MILCTISLKYYYLKILYTFTDLIQYGGLLSTRVFSPFYKNFRPVLNSPIHSCVRNSLSYKHSNKNILNSLCLRPLTTRAKGTKSKRGENFHVYSIISLIPFFFAVVFSTRVVRVFDRALDKQGSLNISSQCLCYQTFP